MENTVYELGTDLLMSEISWGYPGTPRWVSSLDNKAAVALTSNAVMAAVDFCRRS